MTTLAVRILDVAERTLVGGLSLQARAVRLADRAGLDAQVVPVGSPPLAGIAPNTSVVLVGSRTLFSPRVLTAASAGVSDGRWHTPAIAAVADRPLLVYIPAGQWTTMAACASLEAIVAGLHAQSSARPWPMAREFCRPVDPSDPLRVERDYTRALNGLDEGYFTKKIRRWSVPLTSHLVRLGVQPTQVTLVGLLLALGSAWCLSQGRYAVGVVGALLYYASMVFDCSDGEVARLTVRDSAFGAWLETAVDYLTYVLLLGALAMASRTRSDAALLELAVWLSVMGSAITVAVASYLRYRVAGADPGQFDEASATALATSTRFHRFARWGRQWIKRSTMAHLIVWLALVNQAPALLYLWALGAVVAAVVIVTVQPFVIRRVAVAAPAPSPRMNTSRP